MCILGIETSCDETAVALVEEQKGKVHVRANLVASQIKLHRKTGGVVPEVAAREHVGKLRQLLDELDLAKNPPDAISVTRGPGLLTSLLVGTETARALAWVWGVPVLGINHLEGHIYAAFVSSGRVAWGVGQYVVDEALFQPRFPLLALIVSGGHTELVLMRRHFSYRILGETLDDAAGEAFDKVAKLLGLRYPGGPEIERVSRAGSPSRFSFPRPMQGSRDYNFSFAGLKTAVLYTVQREKSKARNKRFIADVAASFQAAVVDTLVKKTVRAARAFGVRTVVLGGGVAANTALRTSLDSALRALSPTPIFYVPPKAIAVDNALMIALAGLLRHRRGERGRWEDLRVDPSLRLSPAPLL